MALEDDLVEATLGAGHYIAVKIGQWRGHTLHNLAQRVLYPGREGLLQNQIASDYLGLFYEYLG